MKMRLLAFVLIALSTALLPSIAAAATLAQDQFLTGNDSAAGEYAAGVSITGTGPTGGTILGFSGNWSGDNNEFGQYTSIASGLNYSSGFQILDTADGAVQYVRTASGQFAKNQVRSTSGFGDNTGYWASTFIQYVSSSLTPASVVLHLEGCDEFSFGITNGQAFFTGSGGGLGSSLAEGETHLLVAHIREPGDGGNELVDLWVNPSQLGVDMLGDPLEAATYTGNSGSNNFIFNVGSPFSQLDLNADFGQDDLGFFDEVRVGTSFADVVPFTVPEPASVAMWSLLGLGLAGFCYYRTRKSA